MHIYTTHLLKLGMDQRREKEGVVIPSHFYTTHRLNLGWIREEKKREWLFLVIYTFDMHIYTTYRLKLAMDQRREKEGVVIPSHLYILTCTSTQLTG